jgi:2-dehydro-3-deoxyphosphogluconate aldolase/(4S)-4-hydroxy-2-oxoglutarate aldolase
MGLERGLEVLKFFPAGPSGGLNFLKALAAPYEAVQFIPTGGIAVSDLREYLLFPRVLAVGGSWIAKDATIASGNFEEITAIAREAVMTALGFELAHVGVNEESSVTATASAQILQRLFFFPIMDGKSSLMVGGVELMKSAYLGAHGHLAIATLSVPRAIAFLARKGIGVRRETLKMKDGRPLAIYLDQEIAGFAVHLLQK